tara:strand:+ start:9210 stop:9638 length:429 start_codon:yes stop_codon:yes gene_type:complete
VNIKELIPQREPFLFIDHILEVDAQTIKSEMTFTPELDFFQGHFPSNPIVPGVILNEHCFQTAAAFIAKNEGGINNQLAVVSRVQSAKFKNLVKPEDKIISTTTLVERIANAAFFKSVVLNQDKQKVLIIEFSVALVGDGHA